MLKITFFEERRKAAMNDIKQGMAARKAGAKWGIGVNILRKRLGNPSPTQLRILKCQTKDILATGEEKALYIWCKERKRQGRGFRRTELFDVVKELMVKNNRVIADGNFDEISSEWLSEFKRRQNDDDVLKSCQVVFPGSKVIRREEEIGQDVMSCRQQRLRVKDVEAGTVITVTNSMVTGWQHFEICPPHLVPLCIKKDNVRRRDKNALMVWMPPTISQRFNQVIVNAKSELRAQDVLDMPVGHVPVFINRCVMESILGGAAIKVTCKITGSPKRSFLPWRQTKTSRCFLPADYHIHVPHDRKNEVLKSMFDALNDYMECTLTLDWLMSCRS